MNVQTSQDLWTSLVMEQTGHKSANTIMAYVRKADRWRDPASGGIGR